MRIAEWHVSNRDAATRGGGRVQLIFRYGDALIRKRRSAYSAEVIEVHNQTIMRRNVIKIRDLAEGPALAILSALAVSGMQERHIRRPVILTRDRRAEARIHATAQQH